MSATPQQPRAHRRDPRDPASSRPRRGAARAVAAGLLLSPLVYELAATCAARWRGMLGGDERARTPILDAAAAAWEATRESARRAAADLFQDPAWPPGTAIAAAIAWAAAAAWLMHRRGRAA